VAEEEQVRQGLSQPMEKGKFWVESMVKPEADIVVITIWA